MDFNDLDAWHWIDELLAENSNHNRIHVLVSPYQSKRHGITVAGDCARDSAVARRPSAPNFDISTIEQNRAMGKKDRTAVTEASAEASASTAVAALRAGIKKYTGKGGKKHRSL